MRRYEIKITDQDGNPKVINGSDGKPIFNGTFTSYGTNGSVFGAFTGTQSTITGALNVEWDLPVSTFNSPLGGASLRVYGVGLPLLAQAANFNPSVDGTKYCNIVISGGMAKGLPLANPEQYGVLMTSRIQQAFGNWQGTSQTLDFIMVLPTGSKETPLNFSFSCDNNAPLAPAIENTLKNVFSNASAVNINISSKLVSPEPIKQQNFTLETFSKFLNERSRSIIGGTTYPGIQVSFVDNIINVYDYTTPPTSKPIQIQFTDLIGQPTWIAPYTLTFKTVMRYDLKVGGQILMPQQSATKGLILTLPQTQSQFKTTSNFKGTFNIQSVRHIGIFRQGDANSWVTVIQAYVPPNSTTSTFGTFHA